MKNSFTLSLQDIINVREQIQEDLITIMDELPEELISQACQIVVDRMESLLKTKKGG